MMQININNRAMESKSGSSKENEVYIPLRVGTMTSNQRYMDDTSDILEESKFTESHLTSS